MRCPEFLVDFSSLVWAWKSLMESLAMAGKGFVVFLSSGQGSFEQDGH